MTSSQRRASQSKPNEARLHRRETQSQRPETASWRQTAYDIIFLADTPAGRWFDIGLLIAILASIAVISLETVPEYRDAPQWMTWLSAAEWMLTGLFTIEYVMRLACVRHPLRYAVSFWGIVDLLSILPSYASLVVGRSSRSFVILRSIRLLRVFRVLKLWRMMSDADELSTAVWRARNKVVVFLAVLLVAVTISGTLMYHVEADFPGHERPDSQFTSIPQSMYWAIVTMTTVGYGDVVPKTTPGKMISAVLILLGYSLIIVPTGFVSAELSGKRGDAIPSADASQPPQTCDVCGRSWHRVSANFCDHCGASLDVTDESDRIIQSLDDA